MDGFGLLLLIVYVGLQFHFASKDAWELNQLVLKRIADLEERISGDEEE